MIKCPKCGTENKDKAKFCRRCKTRFDTIYTDGKQETSQPSTMVWRPDWKWHIKTLLIIYAVIIALYFATNAVLKPYIRHIPEDVTPWLKK